MTERRHDPDLRGFASDNYGGVHPEILDALAVANGGHQVSYGEDVYTESLQQVFKHHFGPAAHAYPVFNGTGANVVALQSMTERWDSVICAESAHINVDECGAPEKVAGLKLLTLPTPDGKLTPELVDRHAWGWGDEHRAQPRVVALTQSTELGTCYTPEEIAALCDQAHQHGMKVYLDGARLANAAATLGLPLKEFTTDVGVDVLSFGGTKNGMMLGEAQLSSKMRFISVQFEALLGTDLWLRNATHANAMTQRLYAEVKDLPGLEVVRTPQANAVYAILPAEVTERLQKRFRFYTWNEHTGEVRWMTSFDTTEADIDVFAAAIAEELQR
jgi:threonine aldolase